MGIFFGVKCFIFEGLEVYFVNRSDLIGLFYVIVMLLVREFWDFIL